MQTCVRNSPRCSTSWSATQLDRGALAWLSALPDTQTVDVDGLGPVLFCHGSPRSDEEILTRISSEERVAAACAGVEEAVVVCGHTHVQFDRKVAGTRLVNAGSVGMPYEAEPGAYWALLGPDVELRRTPYDLDAAIERLRAGGMPAFERIEELMRTPPAHAEVIEHAERVVFAG